MIDRNRYAAFTLVELILVMGLLALLMALAAPSLSRTLRQRGLAQEAARLLATIEYARSEAISTGVPKVVWIDAESGRFGVASQAGYTTNGTRDRSFALNPDVHFAPVDGPIEDGVTHAMNLHPDGVLDPNSVSSIRLMDRFDSAVDIEKMPNGWDYQLARGTR